MVHDYSTDKVRRFFCQYNGKTYYISSQRFYSNDKFDNESTKLIVHKWSSFHGANLAFENNPNGEFTFYYKDDADGMKNWMLYIHKQSDIDYFTPMFHKNKCSMFVLESSDANSVYIKETKYNVFLYLNETKKRDSNSFYVGATTEINKATKFKYKDIL